MTTRASYRVGQKVTHNITRDTGTVTAVRKDYGVIEVRWTGRPASSVRYDQVTPAK